MRHIFAIIFWLLLACTSTFAQGLVSIYTAWSDSFREWVIVTDDEDINGELELRFGVNDDWTQWTFQVGETYGQIAPKWTNQLDEWELRSGSQVVTAKAMWRGDATEWRIRPSSGPTYIWQSRYKNQADEWFCDTDYDGYLEMVSTFEGDPREWNIVDELDKPIPEKIMLLFITLFHTTPKT